MALTEEHRVRVPCLLGDPSDFPIFRVDSEHELIIVTELRAVSTTSFNPFIEPQTLEKLAKLTGHRWHLNSMPQGTNMVYHQGTNTWFWIFLAELMTHSAARFFKGFTSTRPEKYQCYAESIEEAAEVYKRAHQNLRYDIISTTPVATSRAVHGDIFSHKPPRGEPIRVWEVEARPVRVVAKTVKKQKT